ncbi:MAG: ABC transporter permease [Aigarchaeota archaeon]|nr:ABC transporter permease [Candidatus Pelearchaeum maunauluense]
MALTPMVPLLLGAVGEIITERAGVVNIGIEGIFLLSALTSAVVSFYTGNVTLAILVGLATGAVVGVLHGIISVYLRGDQIVSGVGLNLFAYGIGVITLITLWNTFGNSPPVKTVPKISIAGRPISPLTFITIAIAIAAWYFLFKTNAGLRLRACGEDPRAAEAMGVNIMRVRFLATILGATLAGLGGVYLSVDWVGQFTKEISAGRGFIALANVAFSNWNPLLAIIGAYIFGFFDASAIYLSITSAQPILTYLFKAIPYLGTLAVAAIFVGRARIPAALGKPYIKE